MARSFNGFGTAFYGKRDFRADGTFVTTEWVLFCYIPVIPLNSMRVRYQGPARSSFYIGIGAADSYAVYEKTKPNTKQVACIYGFTLFVIVWQMMVGSLFEKIQDETFAWTFLFFGLSLPIPIPLLLRYFAKRRLRI